MSGEVDRRRSPRRAGRPGPAARAGRQRGEVARQRRGADQVDHDVDPRPAGALADDLGEVLAGVSIADVEPERGRPARASRRVRDVPKTVQPIAWASWHGRRADAAADGVDQDPLAGPQPALGLEGVVRGEEDLGDGRGLLEVEVGGDRHGHPLVGHDVLGLPAAADDPEDAVADLRAARSRPARAPRPRRRTPAPGCRPARPPARGSARGPASGRPGSTRRPAPGPALVPPGLRRRNLANSRTSDPPAPVMTMAFMSLVRPPLGRFCVALPMRPCGCPRRSPRSLLPRRGSMGKLGATGCRGWLFSWSMLPINRGRHSFARASGL